MRQTLLISLIVFFTVGAWSQSFRVLVVAFDKFQFECPMPIEEIADHNQLSDPGMVYDAYASALLEAMNAASDSISILSLDEHTNSQLKRRLPRVYKREPISHNGVDLKDLHESGKLKEYLNNMGADYFMVISKYKILGKVITSRGSWESSGFLKWSIHQVDYEVFDKGGELVALADRFLIKPRNPRSDNYQTEGVALKDLRRDMTKLGKDLENKLKKHQKKGKAIYKSTLK